MIRPSHDPLLFLASYAEKENFFQDYMYHVPSGGVFLNLGDETPLALRSLDRRELLGQTADVTLEIHKPSLRVQFRGAVTFAGPFEPGQIIRRIGVEFFRYENSKKNFLLDQINALAETAQIPQRKSTRLPARLRVQFSLASVAGAAANLHIRSVTEEVSTGGCSFHSIRKIKPGEKLNLKIHLPTGPDVGQTKNQLQALPVNISGTVRWNNPDFSSRLIGIEFNFADQQDPEAEVTKRKLQVAINTLREEIETELLTRRIPAEWF